MEGWGRSVTKIGGERSEHDVCVLLEALLMLLLLLCCGWCAPVDEHTAQVGCSGGRRKHPMTADERGEVWRAEQSASAQYYAGASMASKRHRRPQARLLSMRHDKQQPCMLQAPRQLPNDARWLVQRVRWACGEIRTITLPGGEEHVPLSVLRVCRCERAVG